MLYRFLLCVLCLAFHMTACTTRPEQMLDEDWVKEAASEARLQDDGSG